MNCGELCIGRKKKERGGYDVWSEEEEKTDCGGERRECGGERREWEEGGEKKGVEGREGRGGSMEEERSRVQEYKTNSK